MSHGIPACCPHPIFVVGAPRSGTTALAKALSRHSHLWASEETFILASLFGDGRVEREFQRWTGRGSSWLSVQGVDQREFLEYVGLGFNALFTSRSRGRRWIDHTPHHVFMIDALADMFPGAHFLHILRDGRAVVNSMMHLRNRVKDKVRTEMDAGDFLPRWTRDFDEACRVWRASVETGMAAAERHGDRCLTVYHSELTASTEAEFGKLFEFIGVPFEPGPIAFWQTTRINSSFVQGPAVAAPSPVGQLWNEWPPEWRDVFRREAADTLLSCRLASPDELDGLA